MKQMKAIGVVVIALIATAAVTTSPAWAEAPEMGRCVAQTGGKYTDNLCTKLAKPGKTGSYEWFAGAVKNKFTGAGGAATLETVHAVKVSCKTEESTGEFTGPKTVGNVHVAFTGCESLQYKCENHGGTTGVINTNPLSGSLVWEKYGKKAAIDLVPQETELFVEFECGPANAKVKGSVLANIPVKVVKTSFEEKFTAKKGKQKPEYYYTSKTEKVQDVLMSKIGGPGVAFEQAGQTVTNTQTDEEPLEVNPVV